MQNAPGSPQDNENERPAAVAGRWRSEEDEALRRDLGHSQIEKVARFRQEFQGSGKGVALLLLVTGRRGN